MIEKTVTLAIQCDDEDSRVTVNDLRRLLDELDDVVGDETVRWERTFHDGHLCDVIEVSVIGR